ncbi:MAG: hypothetical protein ACREBO_09550 [Novosphingobium sp.]
MPRSNDAIWFVAAALVGLAGLLLKLTSGDRMIVADFPRADVELVARLRAAGFAIDPRQLGGGRQYLARRGECRVVVGLMDRLGQDIALWEAQQRDRGRLTYRIGPHASTTYPRWRAGFAEQSQRQLARLGIGTSRPALIGLAEWGRCEGVDGVLAPLRVHLHRGKRLRNYAERVRDSGKPAGSD